MTAASPSDKFRELDTVILLERGPVNEGIARLATVASVRDGDAWVEGRRFPMGATEAWDLPADSQSWTRYMILPDTPENRRFHGLR